MTPRSLTPQDRKDITSLMLHQIDAPCLPDGCAGDEAESVMAFLMRLYAYFVAKFYAEMRDADSAVMSFPVLPSSHDGTAALKARLMMSGPYQVCLTVTDYDARPNALTVKSVAPTAATWGWLILWPGAARDIFCATGRLAPSFFKDLPSFGEGAATVQSAIKTAVVHIADMPMNTSTLVPWPVRLIPP